jgi:hypothetical protein
LVLAPCRPKLKKSKEPPLSPKFEYSAIDSVLLQLCLVSYEHYNQVIIGLSTSVANDFMFAVVADEALSHSSHCLTMDKMAILMDKMVLRG